MSLVNIIFENANLFDHREYRKYRGGLEKAREKCEFGHAWLIQHKTPTHQTSKLNIFIGVLLNCGNLHIHPFQYKDGGLAQDLE